MGTHPINLALRFVLEICTLAAVGYWGWKQGDGPIRYLLAFGLPIALAVLWGVFAVPGDPSRSGETVVATPGFARLILELAFFAFGTWTLYAGGSSKSALVFGIIVIVHYALSYDRIMWLLSH